MKLIDLSHPLFDSMPVYPGSESPVFETVATVSHEGYAEKRITLFSHTGTHLDAPSHILSWGLSLDRLPVDHFAGSASVLDFSSDSGRSIEIDDLIPYRYLIQNSDFVLIHTGWSRHWGLAAYYTGYPILSGNAADWICGFSLKGLGIDAISVDPLHSPELPVHRRLLEQQVIIVENLTRLQDLPQSGFTFFALPLRIQDSDGSPVRAVAMI
ncbi:MAG: cyclase family protein [Deltaproteobacteria bacterium]|nr:cyclase family protein [Deltaproteobacteria bacterium]